MALSNSLFKMKKQFAILAAVLLTANVFAQTIDTRINR